MLSSVRDWKQVSIQKYTKSHASLTAMVNLNILEIALEKCWICEKFEFSEPDFYKQVTTVRCDET